MTSTVDLALNSTAAACGRLRTAIALAELTTPPARGPLPDVQASPQASLTPAPASGRSNSARVPTCSNPQESIWAVRVDRPDGTHNYVGPETGEPAAEARRTREQHQWAAAGLWAPSVSVVKMAATSFVSHARRHPNCTSTECPRSTDPPSATDTDCGVSPGPAREHPIAADISYLNSRSR